MTSVQSILRETFGFKQGTQITISKSDKKKTKAVAVSLTDVTPADYDGIDDELWLGRCRFILGESMLAFANSFVKIC